MLIPNWKLVLRKAWSCHLSFVAGVLGAAEVVLPFFTPDWPRGYAAGIAAFVAICAPLARVLAQREISGKQE